MATKKQMQEDKARAIEQLLEVLKPGDTVSTVLKHVSRSGMYRRVAVMICQDGAVRNISGLVSRAAGFKWCDDDSVGVSGCGMDVGFEVVYNLARVLWPDGHDCTGENCHSNDHSNGMPRVKQYTAETCPGRPCGADCDHRGVPDVRHKDSGYALRQRWA